MRVWLSPRSPLARLCAAMNPIRFRSYMSSSPRLKPLAKFFRDTLQENLTIYEEIVPIEYLFGDIFDWLRLIRQNVSLILGIVVGMSFFFVGVAAFFLVLMLSARVRFFRCCDFFGNEWGRALLGLVIAQAVGVVGLGALIGSLLAGGMLLFAGAMGMAAVRPGELFTGAATCPYWEGLPFVYVGLGALVLAVLMGIWVAPSALEAETRLSEKP
jgi:hypothetical protein